MTLEERCFITMMKTINHLEEVKEEANQSFPLGKR